MQLSTGRIVVSYAGVHQAYQLALAADEIGELKAFYCALYDDSSKWGSPFSKVVGPGLMTGRRVEGLDLRKVFEFPWPLLAKLAQDRVYTRGRDSWLFANSAFDWWISRKLAASPPKLFVGTAASDLHCLRALRRAGTFLLHDCPSVHPDFEASLLRDAAERVGIWFTRRLRWLRPDMMRNRKLREYSLADALLVYSDIHRKSFRYAGFPENRLVLCPLWVEFDFWQLSQQKVCDAKRDAPLKVLYVGYNSLRKGIPFLLQAIEACGKAVQLTIVGSKPTRNDLFLGRDFANVRFLPAQPQSELRNTYASHDLFVLPSVIDSFGLVALEAMASGLPVISTENCGVPVPEPSWRVPVMDPESLARRIMKYADDRSLVIQDGQKAAAFAAEYTALAYRRNIQAVFRSVLCRN